MVNMETFEIKLHSCGCGYKTLDTSNANRHKKVHVVSR